MPTYQYACTDCGHQLEVVQGFTDDPLTMCEECGGKLRKVYSAVGVVFKGSGFYRTDSRSGAKSTAGASSSSSGTDSKSSDSGSQSSSTGSSSSGSGKSTSSNPSPAA